MVRPSAAGCEQMLTRELAALGLELPRSVSRRPLVVQARGGVQRQALPGCRSPD